MCTGYCFLRDSCKDEQLRLLYVLRTARAFRWNDKLTKLVTCLPRNLDD